MRHEEMRKERWAHVPHVTTGVTDNIQPPNVALHFPPDHCIHITTPMLFKSFAP